MIDFTSSEPSAQSYSPLHFKEAEIHPPLAHMYSLEEQVGEAEQIIKSTFRNNKKNGWFVKYSLVQSYEM